MAEEPAFLPILIVGNNQKKIAEINRKLHRFVVPGHVWDVQRCSFETANQKHPGNYAAVLVDIGTDIVKGAHLQESWYRNVRAPDVRLPIIYIIDNPKNISPEGSPSGHRYMELCRFNNPRSWIEEIARITTLKFVLKSDPTIIVQAPKDPESEKPPDIYC